MTTEQTDPVNEAQQIVAGLDKDAQIRSLTNQVGQTAASGATRIAQLEALLAHMDAAVGELRQAVADRDATIVKLQTEAMGSVVDSLD